MPRFGTPVILPDGNRASSDLADRQEDNASATLLAGYNTCVTTGAGSFTAPTPAASVGVPPQQFGISNLSTRPVTIAVPNRSGTVNTITILPGASTRWRQYSTSGYISQEGKPQARLDERYRTDLELWSRAADSTVGSMAGQYALTGQAWTTPGYTSTNSDPLATIKVVGTGTAARFTSDYSGNTLLGSFLNATLAGQCLHMKARWTINPNTYNGSSTAGTVNTGTIGMILSAGTFTNSSTVAPNAGLHLAVNPTGWTLAIVVNSTFTQLATGTLTIAGSAWYWLSHASDSATLGTARVGIWNAAGTLLESFSSNGTQTTSGITSSISSFGKINTLSGLPLFRFTSMRANTDANALVPPVMTPPPTPTAPPMRGWGIAA